MNRVTQMLSYNVSLIIFFTFATGKLNVDNILYI